jgi:HD-GYP domain-containing protein (c-di-GMP phosphodiesterase class II)
MTSLGDTEVRYRRLIELGIALSAERSHDDLMQKILLGAKDLTNADGGTLYLVTDDRTEMRFAIMRNDTLAIALGGTTGATVPFPPVPLVGADGQPNHSNVAAAAAVTGRTINIPDAYVAAGFDFSGPRAFDARTGYRSRSFLTVPLKNHDNDVMGVLQLVNSRSADGTIVPFAAELVPLIEALASQAAVALDNQMLLAAQKNLFRAFLQVFAGAIDAKSPYTGGHCRRVPELTTMLARAAAEAADGPFAGFHLSDDEWYELEVAGGLHDCGKVTTREYVVDKATKLETIYNRIHEIRTRFEVVKRDVEIAYLRAVLAGGDAAALAAARDRRLAELDADFAFLAECNVGTEFMASEKVARLERIAQITWLRTLDDRLGSSWEEEQRRAGPPPPLPVLEHVIADKPEHVVAHDAPPLTPDNPWRFNVKPPAQKFNLGELYNLKIRRGTLTEEERFHINDHMVQTIIMLEALPFPKTLRRVPEWAGGHHEKMDGTGYPRGLTREQMSVPARIMAIADIFEALTSRDRPYKTPKKLSECIAIMARMSEDKHIDDELFALFLTSGVYRRYAELFLLPEQVDDVDILGYLPKAAVAAE